MSEAPDVYRDWLGITDKERPLNYYQLLRLAKFEDNTQRIRTHYRKMHAHVQKFATEYPRQAQQLLNELARAMLCLTDIGRKRAYDASLGRQEPHRGRPRTFEEILLANQVIDQEQLTKARNFAGAVGLDIRDAVLQQKMATPETVMLAYAESQGLPYVELDEIGVDEQLVRQVPPSIARQHSCVPVMADGGQLLMASADPLVPDVEEDLRLRLGIPVRTVLSTPAEINAAITKYFPRDMPEPAHPRERVAAARPAARPTAKEARPKSPSQPPDSSEQTRQRLMMAIVAFNIVVVVTMLFRVLASGGRAMTFSGFLLAALLAVVLGLIAGAVTFYVASKSRI